MARLASIANAGFEPIPTHLISGLASLVEVSQDGDYAVFDPCSGKGEAIIGMVRAWWSDTKRKDGDINLYACEMEETRFKELNEQDRAGLRWGHFTALHGDAFSLSWDSAELSLLYVNPPFDTDPTLSNVRRMEEKFLRRLTPMLYSGGVLLFVLPYYAIKHSAETIAKNYTNVHVVRFPDEDFSTDPKAKAYKRAIVLGEKHATLDEPDPVVLATLNAAAEDWRSIPSTWDRPLVKARPKESAGIRGLVVLPLDVEGMLAKWKPFHYTDRGGKLLPLQGLTHDKPAHEVLERVFPVAMPLKPAYLASGIAAGVFNGELIAPDDSCSTLPSILLKGVFHKEFVHVPSEDKRNKDGEKTAETHVQQPELVITILDLRTKKYSQLRSSVDTTGETDPSKMTVGDLIQHYGRSMIRAMEKACPVLHDGARDAERAEVPGLSSAMKLFSAQENAVTALVKILGGLSVPLSARRKKAAFLLGEVGVGKTGISLATTAAIGSKCALVVCPPITVPVWQKQVSMWFPDVRTVVLDDVADVHALAQSKDPRRVIAIMSRETGKLGHAWAGISTRCPSCNTQPQEDADTLARKRTVCGASTQVPSNELGRITVHLGQVLAPCAPNNPHVYQAFKGRLQRRALAKWRGNKDHDDGSHWQRVLDTGRLVPIVDRLVATYAACEAKETAQKIGDAILGLLVAIGDDSLIARIAKSIYLSTAEDLTSWGIGADKRQAARVMLALLPKVTRDELAAELRGALTVQASYGGRSPWVDFDAAASQLDTCGKSSEWGYKDLERGIWKAYERGSIGGALQALERLIEVGLWRWTPSCKERLYQAIPEPRRVALAPYIAKRFPKLFDCLIVDEAHENANQDSAQSMAAQRLAQLGIPTMMLTGSIMNGYAASLFILQWMADPEFRAEFSRDQLAEFVRRYGYVKMKVEYRDKDSGKVVEFGAVSDRVERTQREAGNAPGVLPLFVLQYLLKKAVVIHKEDLAIDLPPNKQIVEHVDPGILLPIYRDLAGKLKAQIKRDAFGPMAGKLFGQVAELSSYLDRATEDVGNCADGWWRIRYPADSGGGLVAEASPLPSSTILPKEQWMLDKIRAELAEGRNVLVYGYHTEILPRLRRLIQEQLSEPCALILSGDKAKIEKTPKKLPAGVGPVVKLDPKRREPWIEENVKNKIRVMVINSEAVQVGLNSLVWFNTIIWMENPAVDPIGYRQANGRIYRPGQEKETRVYFPIYVDTAQEQSHSLLMLKVGVSESTDGLDARGAMAAAGVGKQDTMSAFGVGKQLFALIEADEARPKPKREPMVIAQPQSVTARSPEPEAKPEPVAVPRFRFDPAPEPSAPQLSLLSV